jgi:hypothetical protein
MAEAQNGSSDSGSSNEGAPSEVARVEAETHDEIDDIMAEIERIKNTMTTPIAGSSVETASESVTGSESSGPASEAEVVQEVDFGAANTDAPLEETLGAIEVEEASGGVLSDSQPEIVAASVESMPEGVFAGEPVEGVAPAAVMEAKEPFVPKLVPEMPSVSRATFQPIAPRSQSSRPGESGSLSMTLSGSMTLSLKYEMDGQEVTIGFDDSFLHLSLADGTEFKIPVGRSARKNAAA